jgi:putative tryptophan/tyrosine transport system substrate-binding protein
MNRRVLIAGLGSAAAWPLMARAQQPAKPVIGFLSGYSAGRSAWIVAAFRQGLGETGYVEGRNVALEFRWAEWLAGLLSIESPDDFGPDRETRAVVGSVAGGLVTSLNRPSANLTGVSPLDTEMVGKRLELCHQLVPAGCWNICHPPVRTRRPADRGRSPWPTQVS